MVLILVKKAYYFLYAFFYIDNFNKIGIKKVKGKIHSTGEMEEFSDEFERE